MEFKDLGSLLAEAAKNKKKGNWKDDVCDVEPLNTDKSKDYGSKVVWEEPKSYSSPKSQHTTQRSVKPSTSNNDSSGDAQKKFGAAKSISSAQYFGDNNAVRTFAIRFHTFRYFYLLYVSIYRVMKE